MYGTRPEFPNETFDFVFSFSSIGYFDSDEYVGSLYSVVEGRYSQQRGITYIGTEYSIQY